MSQLQIRLAPTAPWSIELQGGGYTCTDANELGRFAKTNDWHLIEDQSHAE